MDNYTTTPVDEYDVLIEGDLDNEVEQCDGYTAQVLSAQQVLQLSCALFVIGVLDNALVVLVLVKHKGLKLVENIYFLNLAISNLCFLLSLPLRAHTALHGGSINDPMCRVLSGLHAVGAFSEAFLNTLLTVQRYVVFFHVRCLSPAFQTVRGGTITSVLAWVVAVVVTLSEGVLYKPPMELQTHKCSLSRSHVLPASETFWKHFLTLKMNILVLVFPLLVFVFCYVQMRKPRRLGDSGSDLLALTFAITAVFLLMWAPYNVVLFLSAFKECFSLHDCQDNYKLDVSVQVTELIAATHCCVTPLLYVFLDGTFREYLFSLFPWCKDTSLQPREEAVPGASKQDEYQSTKM